MFSVEGIYIRKKKRAQNECVTIRVDTTGSNWRLTAVHTIANNY